MKTIHNFSLALLAVGLTISCKKMEEIPSSDSAAEVAVESVNDVATTKNDSLSSKSLKSFQTNRKFVRTADIKFKVKNVSQTTNVIENTTNKFGGFVTNTNLQSNVSEKDEIKISQDSAVVITKYTVDNNITIRVPNQKLDTIIKTIAKQIDFLDYRVIKADDVSLQLLSNELAQNRNKNHETRLANAIDKKGKKLNDVVAAENDLENKKKENDNSKVENISLNDQISFSTLTLNVYQRETIKQEKIANAVVLHQNIGSQIIDSLLSGWYLLEGTIAFLVQLWSVFLILFLTWLGYKNFKNKNINL